MAATDDSFELTSAEQTRLEKAIQTVSDRRNGEISLDPVVERANLPEGTVREALNRAAAAGTRIERQEESRWVMSDE